MNYKESNHKAAISSSLLTQTRQMPTSKPQKMADPPDSQIPCNQCLPYLPGESKLELMPTELLQKIFEQLSQNKLQSRDDYDHVFDINRTARTNMRSLCLTSKHVDAAARPLLFRYITVRSCATLLRLYETLVANAQLGFYVRQISFEILREKVKLWDFLPARSPQIQSLLTGWDEEFGKNDLAAFNDHACDQIISSCYFEILRRTPKVHRLVIRIQPTSRVAYPMANGLDGATGIYMYQPFFRKVRHAVQASLTEQSEFLPRLTTLQLLGDPFDHRNVFDITICEPLLQIQTLRRITTFRDNGFWSALKSETPGTAKSDRAFTNVRAAELHHGTFHSLDFSALGVLLANVEVLKISTLGHTEWMFAQTRRREQEQNLGEGIDYFQEALTQMKNLRNLSLDFTHDSSRKGLPATKLPILASLPKLETVSIPLQMLEDDCRRTRRNQLDRFVEVFPISLKRLTLQVNIPCPWDLPRQEYRSVSEDDDEYRSDSEDDDEYRSDSEDDDMDHPTWPQNETLLDFVEPLSHLGHDAFPYLREVVCSYRTMIHGPVLAPAEAEPLARDFEKVDLRGFNVDSYQRLMQLRASLQQQQIRFSMAFESAECTRTDCEEHWGPDS